MLLYYAFPSQPITVLPVYLRTSTADTFGILLQDPDFKPLILLMTSGYSESTENPGTSTYGAMATRAFPWLQASENQIGIDVTLWLSDEGLITGPDKDIPHLSAPARLSPPLNYKINLFSGPEPQGEGTVTLGDISVINNDGVLDEILNYKWDGRPMTLLGGAEDIDIAEFGVIYKGTVSRLAWDKTRITFSMRSLGERFRQPLFRNKYAGTGDEEGDADIADLLRPFCIGQVRNAEAVLVESSSLLYQAHDGAMEAIDAVRDRGVALTFASDFSTVTDLLNATAGSPSDDIEAGEYGTCIAAGYFRLGAQPAGLITFDGQGDKLNGQYVSNTADIIRRIVTTRMPAQLNLTIADLDLDKFSDLATKQPAIIGFYVSRQDVFINSVINELMSGIGGYWYFNRSGQLAIDRLDAPDIPSYFVTEKQIINIARVAYPPPTKTRRVGYKRIYAIQGDEELAASVTADDRQFYRKEYRFSEYSEIQSLHPLAREVQTLSLFDVKSDADDEAQRLQDLHGVQRDIYRITLKRAFLRVYVGTVINVTHSRFNLSNGKNFVVKGLEEFKENIVVEAWG